MTKAQIGECGELLVAVDLMRRGYEVFKAMNPRCTCDLIAMKDTKCWRVQVKVGLNFLPSEDQLDWFDVLAVVKTFGSIPRVSYVGRNKDLAGEL